MYMYRYIEAEAESEDRHRLSGYFDLRAPVLFLASSSKRVL